MPDEVSVDLLQLRDAADSIENNSRKIREQIIQLNQIRKRLSSGDVWQGEGAEATTYAFTQTLKELLLEERRINTLAIAMKDYANELEENERVVAQASNAGIGENSSAAA